MKTKTKITILHPDGEYEYSIDKQPKTEASEPKKSFLKLKGYDALRVSDFCKKHRSVKFSHYRQGYLYYTIEAWAKKDGFDEQLQEFIFPVEVADLGSATVNLYEKSITMMRYIRKAIEDGTMARIWPKPEKVL